MSLSLSSLPPEFAWLRTARRPSRKEVDTYAHLIAHVEGYPQSDDTPRLFGEAELQLWAARAETPASRPRRKATRAAS